MIQYTKLPIPKDTAWDIKRKPIWLRYVNWRIKEFFRSVYNVIRWLPRDEKKPEN